LVKREGIEPSVQPPPKLRTTTLQAAEGNTLHCLVSCRGFDPLSIV